MLIVMVRGKKSPKKNLKKIFNFFQKPIDKSSPLCYNIITEGKNPPNEREENKMEEITMFRAEDGKMFEDEDECREYECEVAADKVKGQIALFGESRKPLPFLPQAIDEVFYARIDTEEAFDWFKDTLYDRGAPIEGLYWYDKPDIYMWDADAKIGDTWLSWNKIVEGMNEERNALIQSGILNAWG